MRTTAILILALLVFTAHPARSQNRITYNGQDLFLSGGNVAWVDFARDIGPGMTNLERFDQAFADVHAHGGNAMRLWLHTTGAVTPEWSGNDVVGPGAGAIEDLRDILDLAKRHEVGLILCLWSFDMLRISNGSAVTDRAYALLTDPALIQKYIDNALIPMVDSLKGHPGIIAWEIFNEAEGMSNEFGWDFNRHVPMADIQRFVNMTTGAIHRTDPNAKVTNGAWSFKALSDAVGGGYDKNYYRDDRLIEAGGDPDGTLDFYTVHYYEWAGTLLSPFHHDYSYWGLDKPLVVAEFYLSENNDGNYDAIYGVPYQDAYETLYDRGYAGALAWQWIDWYRNNSNPQWPRARVNMDAIWSLHRADVDIVPTFGINYFKARPDTVQLGGSSTLWWSVADAASVTLDGVAVDSAGTKVIGPAETTTYTLAATGRGGGTLSEALTVVVEVPERLNRALGKPGTASSSEAGLGHDQPSYAFDGNNETRWSSEWQGAAPNPDDQWIYVDLGKTYSVVEVQLDWESAYAKSYDIDVSPDAQTWTTVKQERNGDGGTDVITLDPFVEARYVRMHGLQRATTYGYSLFEFEVYGNPQVTRYELEDATLSGDVSIQQSSSASDGSYVSMVSSGSITLNNVQAPAAGEYTLTIGYYLPFSEKKQYLDVNDVRVGEIEFAVPINTWLTKQVTVNLKEGVNKIAIVKSWGWMYFDYIDLSAGTAVAADDGDLPLTFALAQNYPNPLRASTRIEYSVPTPVHVRIDVFDLTGRRVRRVVDAPQPAGTHYVDVDARDLPSGVYVYRIQAGSYSATRRMVVVH